MRIVVIADVHSNLPALEAFIKRLEGITPKPDRIYCAGDLVGYYPWPNECIEMIRDLTEGRTDLTVSFACVRGNHDEFATNDLPLDMPRFNAYAAESLRYTRRVLSKKNREFLRSLSKYYADELVYMIHGGVKDPLFQYMYDVNTSDLEGIEQPLFIHGHTHVPYSKIIGNQIAINPGSIAQPRDGIAMGSFVIIDIPTNISRSRDARLKNVRFRFDIGRVAERIIESGLPKFLADRLYEGV